VRQYYLIWIMVAPTTSAHIHFAIRVTNHYSFHQTCLHMVMTARYK